ncbi:MAG: hypothetical protein AAGI30_02765 [Planctomycetota bacterium]
MTTASSDADRSLQGLVASAADESALLDALEQAFDYRGDITLTLTDGRGVEGYLFDRVRAGTLAASYIRVMIPEPDESGSDKVTISLDRIARLEFTGKDTAHGKSFERWVERFVKSKLEQLERAGNGAAPSTESPK